MTRLTPVPDNEQILRSALNQLSTAYHCLPSYFVDVSVFILQTLANSLMRSRHLNIRGYHYSLANALIAYNTTVNSSGQLDKHVTHPIVTNSPNDLFALRNQLMMMMILLVWQPIGWISYKQSTKERK